VLAEANSTIVRIEPKSPHDMLRSLATVAEQLAGPARSAGSEALAKARDLVAEVDVVDREIAELKQNDDEAEAARIEERIAVIDSQEKFGEERQQMRALLANQLELMRRMHGRLVAAQSHREKINDNLRALWLQVGGLSTEQSNTQRSITNGPITRSGER
ncbi:MAG: hypothetical protein ABJC26_14470, partial [Gemmatimonadaceae bacterium]